MSRGRRFQLAAGTIVVLSVLTLLLALGTRRIWNADYWWQWKTGEYVSLHGVPETDVFSYTRPEHPRLELRWGYCLWLYETSQWLGRGSAVVVKCLVLVVTFCIAASIAGRRSHLLITCAVVALAALASSQRFFLRPEFVTYLLFVLHLAIIECARRGPTRGVLALPLLSVLWVNTHGLFVLGPALLGAWLVAELLGGTAERLGRGRADPDRRRRLITSASLLVLSLVCSLVNPYLHRALLLPLVQLSALHGTAMKEFYTELRSPFAFSQTYTALFYYKLMLVLAAASVALNPRRQQLFRLIVVTAMAYLSVTAIRNIPLFCIAAVPLVIDNLAQISVRQTARLARFVPALRGIGAVVLIAFCLAQSHDLWTNEFNLKQGDTNQFGIGLAHNRYPERATRFLQGTNVVGRIFNSSSAGSYLLAHGFPVFIDPRGEIYMDGLIDEYREIVRRPSSVPRYVTKYDFRVMFLDTTMTPLIEYLHEHPRWRLVHIDPVATIAFRSDVAPGVPAVDLRAGGEAWLASVLAESGRAVSHAKRSFWTRLTPPQPYVDLARLCFVLEAYGPARTLFERGLSAYPATFDHYDLLAYTAMNAGDLTAAARYYDKAIEQEPDKADLYKRAAKAHQGLADLNRAAEMLDAALDRNPEDAEALAFRGIVDLQRSRFEEAKTWIERAIALDDRESAYHLQHGEILLMLREVDQAVAALETAYRLDPSNSRAARDLGEVRFRQGRLDDARVWADRAHALDPRDTRVVELHRRLGAR